MSKPLISIVIGTYNQKEVLARVLDGYTTQTFDPKFFEVVVVDSGSNDGSADLLSDFKPAFHFKFIIQENQGKSGARNRGVKEANSDYIIITDADMIPEKSFVEIHLKAQQSSEKPTCFEGVTYNLKKLHWPPQKKLLIPYITEKLKNNAKLGFHYFLTGNISFPKSIFESENGFSLAFKGYGWEDLELGYRLRNRNIPLRFLKSAENYHYHVITKQEEIDRCYSKGESAKIFLGLHPELKLFLGMNPLSVFIFKKTKETGWLYKRMQENFNSQESSVKHRLGFWFLKEYRYLEGVLS